MSLQLLPFACRWLLLSWLALSQSLAVAHRTDVHEKLSIKLTAQYYPPYINGESNDAFLTKIVLAAFKLGQVEVVQAEVPNNRAISGVMQGLYEGSYGWGYTAERASKLLYSSKPIYSLHVVFFQRQHENHHWDKLGDLRRLSIGAVQGNFYSEEFTHLQQRAEIQVDYAPSDVSNFRKLLSGRIDLLPIDAETGHYILQKHFTAEERQKVVAQTKSISVVPVYVVINKAIPKAHLLMQRFDWGFQQLSESGQLAKIIEAYKLQQRN